MRFFYTNILGIVTEDLNPNQLYRGMAIVNPFAKS